MPIWGVQNHSEKDEKLLCGTGHGPLSTYILGGSLDSTWKLRYSDLKFSKISFDEILALSLYIKVR